MFRGVPASITLSQAALESGWNTSGLSQNANNFFGIKAHGWGGATYDAQTQEYYGGYTTVNAEFRAYPTAYGSFVDHAKFLKKYDRYDNLFELSKTDYIGWAKGLKASGYATSPTYDSKLINLIETYNLDKYDRISNAIKWFSIGAIIIVLLYLFKRFLLSKLAT